MKKNWLAALEFGAHIGAAVSPVLTGIAALLAFSFLSTGALAKDSDTEMDGPYSVMFYAPGHNSVMGFAQLKETLQQAVAEGAQQCKDKGGENCYPGLAYNQCGAVAELQLGNKTGNPKGWAPAKDLKTALDLSLKRCNSFARRIAISRFEDDAVFGPLAKTAQCAVSFYHCTSWGPVDLEASFGVPANLDDEPMDMQ